MVQRVKAKPKASQAAVIARSELAKQKAEKPHLFKKGMPKPEGSGRKKGQTNKHSAVLKDCIMTAMDMVGSNNRGKDGAAGYLAHLAWKKPEIFGKLLEKVLPFSLSGAGGGPVQVEYTNREEITLRLKERGLPQPTNLIAPPPKRAEPIDADFDEVEDDE